MTESQRTGFYIPIWLEIANHLGWRMGVRGSTDQGRLVADLDRQAAESDGADLAGGARLAIIEKAQDLAGREARGVTADDLRRGCNWLASNGRHLSSKKFSRSDFNHFDRLKNIL